MRNLTRAWILSSVALLALTMMASTALAQTPELNDTSFQVERFEPMPAQGANILNMQTSLLVSHDRPTVGVFFHYVDDPIQLIDEETGEVVSSVIARQLKAEVWGGIGIHDVLDIGFVVPVVFFQEGDDLAVFDDPGRAVQGAALADTRIVPRLRLLNPDVLGGLGASLSSTVFLPSGDTDTFNSDGRVRVEPRLAVDYTHSVGLTITGNIAYLFRPERTAQNLVIDDVVRWGFGVKAPTGVDGFSVIGSVFGDAPLEENRSVDDFDERVRDGKGAPIEWLAGLEFGLPHDMVLNAGGGTGLTEGVGAPDFRVFLSFGYTPTSRDQDGDGIYDDDDDCPKEAEDKDGFEDLDGCPDYDNDDDGILDPDDACPMDPEDEDGFEDADGCPDDDNDDDGVLDVDDDCPDTPGSPEKNGCPVLDRDGDGLLDAEDQCPDDPEDKDGFEDEDGCPDDDNDGDGIKDADDDCPDDPEDEDGFEDEDGCPDPDNDKDGIPDDEDQCPDEPETINGVDDDDGCPDEGKPKVRITKTKIEILEKVYFDTAKATIKQRSFSLLNQVASVMKANPQITKIRVEGHTDSRGSEEYNQKLSEERAGSVMTYLIGQGIDPGRLAAKGLGESTPIADNSTETGRSRNRRVEFTILEVNDKPVDGDGAVIIEKKETVEEGEDEGQTEDETKEEGQE